MKSTKVHIATVYQANNERLLATPHGVVVLPGGGQFSLLYGLYSCIGMMLSLGHS